MKDKLYKILLANNVKVDTDVYQYGTKILLTYFLFLTILIPISFILKIHTEVLLFLFVFTPLRRYLGGFHFSKNYLCLIFSLILIIMISYLSILTYINNLILKIFIFILLIFLTSKVRTVDHPNKRLTSVFITEYTKKSLFIEIIYCILSVIFHVLNYNTLSNILLYSPVFCVMGNIIARYIVLKF